MLILYPKTSKEGLFWINQGSLFNPCHHIKFWENVINKFYFFAFTLLWAKYECSLKIESLTLKNLLSVIKYNQTGKPNEKI